jgi:hypothetical protein
MSGWKITSMTNALKIWIATRNVWLVRFVWRVARRSESDAESQIALSG